MFLHDIVGDLTAEEARKSFKQPIKENDDDLFAADRKTADPWVTHYIGNPIVGYARIIPDLHSRWKYDPEDLHPEEQKFYHMAGERVPVMDWSERTHFAVIMIGAAHPLRVKTWMLDNVDIDLSLRQQDNNDDELAENDDDLFTNTKTLRERLIVFLKEYSWDAESLASNKDEYEQYYREEADMALKVVDVFLKSGLLDGVHAFLKFNSTMSGNPGQMMEENTGITVADLIELKSSINEESDDDLFAPSDRIEQIERARKDPEWAYEYARDKLRGRWPDAEPYIMRDPYWAQEYADRVIKGRWPEAEPVIMQDPMSAYFYACLTIGGRWLEAEPVILQSQSEWANGYKEHFNIQDDLTENDDDLFAPSKRLTNPMLMARGIVQVADDFDDRADRMATWAAAESYRDDASILRFAARACSSGGLRACMKELSAIDDANTWDYIIEVLQQDFDIDLSRLYDQYENGELTESIEEPESDDDLFADRGLSIINLPKLTTPSLENLFYAFSFETRPDYLPKTRMMMRKIAREFKRRGRPLSDAVLQQHDLQDEQ